MVVGVGTELHVGAQAEAGKVDLQRGVRVADERVKCKVMPIEGVEMAGTGKRRSRDV